MRQTVTQHDVKMNLSYHYKSSAKPKTVLYIRASSTEQPVDVQCAFAKDAGFAIDQIVESSEFGSPTSLLDANDAARHLLGVLRDGDVLVVRWLDRLGRNYDEIAHHLRLLLQRGVTVKTIIGKVTFEARSQGQAELTVQEALLAFMSAMAEAQAVTLKEAQASGIARAKARNPAAYKGRKPSYSYHNVEQIQLMAANGVGINEIARRLGLSKFLVSRINKNIAAAFDALERWGMNTHPPRIDDRSA